MPNSNEQSNTVKVIELKDVPDAQDKGNGKVVNPDYAKGGRYWNCR